MVCPMGMGLLIMTPGHAAMEAMGMVCPILGEAMAIAMAMGLLATCLLPGLAAMETVGTVVTPMVMVGHPSLRLSGYL